MDIDDDSLEVLKALVNHVNIPNNVHINYIHADFLTYCFEKKYDVVVGNPPYKKLTKEKELLSVYKAEAYNTDTNNIIFFFIEKSMRIGNVVSLIVPKSLINAPEFNKTRQLMSKKRVSHIIDFGEKGFKNVKIETINFVVETQRKPAQTIVESYITEKVVVQQQFYLMDTKFP